MSSDIQPYILDELDAVIDQTVANIGLYTKNPGKIILFRLAEKIQS